MGIYLNPGADEFEMALNSEIYVDKSMLLAFINGKLGTKNRYICVSRPRRFGKTMAAEMLCAYYDRTVAGAELFKNLKIARDDSFITYANKYDVIHLTMTEYFHSNDEDVRDVIKQLCADILYDIKAEYSDIALRNENDMIRSLKDVYAGTKRKFVIVIDEWDCVFRIFPQDEKRQAEYLNFLRNWLKDQPFVGLAYMTGILPIKKYGEHSALNMFDEYSMESAKGLSEFTGFTADEVKALCEVYHMDYDECRSWYDGYLLQEQRWDENRQETLAKVYEIYNPLSVVNAMLNHCCENYWNKTETYEALKKYIRLNIAGLRDIVISLLVGNRRCIDTSSFKNDMTSFAVADDVLTLLIHLGYLGYDSKLREIFIPNNEIRDEFAVSVKTDDNWGAIADAIARSEDTLKATWSLEAEAVAERIEKAHFETAVLNYNSEEALSYVVSLAYYTARSRYYIFRELPAGKGFADMVFIPREHSKNIPAMIVELKWDISAKTAIGQIKAREYIKSLDGYKGKVLLVGISYQPGSRAKAYKKHECVIEEIEI